MQSTHTYRVMAWWSSGKTGLAKCESAPNAIHFTAPPQFGGLEGRWTPEDMLLGALASCFTTTFRTIADYSKFEYSDLGVQVEGTVVKADSGYTFTKIVIRPTITLFAHQDPASGLRLLQKAKSLCLVARALAIEQEFEPQVQVGAARACSRESVPVI
jgi:organic hydroperoxide reductase OsmC/OhrA